MNLIIILIKFLGAIVQLYPISVIYNEKLHQTYDFTNYESQYRLEMKFLSSIENDFSYHKVKLKAFESLRSFLCNNFTKIPEKRLFIQMGTNRISLKLIE